MSDGPNTTQATAPVQGQRGAQAQTRAAIAQAAERTGVDFSYLLAQARIESGLDPRAQARTSSASGLFQFIDQTWLTTLDRHGDALGYGGVADAIEMRGGRARIVDPAMRDSIMALRFDPQAASLMAGALAEDNRAVLTPILGRDPDATELYMAHFLGARGASRFLSTLNSAPDTTAANILPAAARANRPIFYERSGAARSVAEVMAVMRGRIERAMEAGGTNPAPPTPFTPLPFTPSPASLVPTLDQAGLAFAPAPPATAPMRVSPRSTRSVSPLARLGTEPSSAARPSMAATLQNSFALTGTDINAPGKEHVRNAYARLEAFGL